MTPAPFTSALTAPLFGDPEAAELLSDRAFIAQMLRVEAALARACAQVGLVSAGDADAIRAQLAELEITPAQLGPGMASAGVPVPALVTALQEALGPESVALHWGATSQDIVDCAHVLQWRALLALLGARLGRVLDGLRIASDAQADTLMAGRTRSQIATPITLGLRLATWAQPLIALEGELPGLRAQIGRAQLGGASGTGAAFGEKGAALTDAFARELGLKPAPCWHLDRTGPQALGGWLVRLAAALAKLARDLILAGRSEMGEMRAGQGGGSSTMPQKSNPVAAEAMVTLAQYAASLHPLLAGAAMPQEDRDGAAWALEWLALPQIGMAASASLRHAEALICTLTPDPARMASHLGAERGAVMAEAATLALARHMPRAKAATMVKDALDVARASDRTLIEVLHQSAVLGALENWTACLAPATAIAPAEAMRQRIWAARQG